MSTDWQQHLRSQFHSSKLFGCHSILDCNNPQCSVTSWFGPGFSSRGRAIILFDTVSNVALPFTPQKPLLFLKSRRKKLAKKHGDTTWGELDALAGERTLQLTVTGDVRADRKAFQVRQSDRNNDQHLRHLANCRMDKISEPLLLLNKHLQETEGMGLLDVVLHNRASLGLSLFLKRRDDKNRQKHKRSTKKKAEALQQGVSLLQQFSGTGMSFREMKQKRMDLHEAADYKTLLHRWVARQLGRIQFIRRADGVMLPYFTLELGRFPGDRWGKAATQYTEIVLSRQSWKAGTSSVLLPATPETHTLPFQALRVDGLGDHHGGDVVRVGHRDPLLALESIDDKHIDLTYASVCMLLVQGNSLEFWLDDKGAVSYLPQFNCVCVVCVFVWVCQSLSLAQ